MLMYFKRQAQVGTLIFNKAPTAVPVEYFNYSNVFLVEYAAELLEYIGINNHAIELEEDKQPLFSPIYSLRPIELKTLKTYIETNMANGFIRFSKFPVRVPIFFDWKPNGSLHFYVDYRDFNNITIKNKYLLPLIGELLDQISWARKFTKLDLTNTYDRMRIHKSDE